MYDFENMDKRLIIFANLFLVANRLQTKMDDAMEELTAKQWLMLAMLGTFDKPPTLKELAHSCDCSHQNVKQLVNKLETKGFVSVTPDPEDGRAMRISATQKLEDWDRRNSENSNQFVAKMFEDLDTEEIVTTYRALTKIYNSLNKL